MTVDFHIDEWGGGVQVKRNTHFLVLRFHLNLKNVSVRFPYSLNLSGIQNTVFKKNLQEWTIENLQFDKSTQTKMKISPPKTNA